MKISIQIIASLVRRLGAIAFITTLAWSVVVLSAPAAVTQPQPPQQQPQHQSQAASTSSSSSSSSSGANVVAKNALTSLLQSVKNIAASQPSSLSPRDGATSAADTAAYEDVALNTFDGKNPFTDDSLWQIPIHLTRDLDSRSHVDGPSATGRADQMAKSASELSAADAEHNKYNHDNDDGDDVMVDEPETTSLLAHQKSIAASSSSASSPTIISASTTGAGAVDLKTAAGYHHATPHHGYGHHDGGHYGSGASGHHDHYGKYFQYASVPYPYAWDFGYRRGNPYHTIERYEHGKGPHFQTKVKWADKYGGYGVHVWDYNHDDHHSHHYGGDGHHHHDSHGPSHHYGGHH